MTATFPFYQLADESRGVKGGFVYKTVPHIQLKDYAQNTRIDVIVERYAPEIQAAEPSGDQAKLAELKRSRREEIDHIVTEDAEPETLRDQPLSERGVVRVSGPFTVEAIPPAALELPENSPIGGAPEVTDGAGAAEDLPLEVPDDAAGHISRLIADLQRDGVTFPGNRVMRFASLTPRGGVFNAEGVPDGDSELKRVAISFGPLHGAVSMRQVEDALYDARRGGFDAVIFCGFAFQAEAQAFISENADPRVKTFLAHIRPDELLVDAEGKSLLRATAQSQLFAVFGEPDVDLLPLEDRTYQVRLNGVEVYDPLTGEVHGARAEQVAAWFVDTDYDGRAFLICQAFFPNRAWDRLARALKGRLDDERLDMLSGTDFSLVPSGTARTGGRQSNRPTRQRGYARAPVGRNWRKRAGRDGVTATEPSAARHLAVDQPILNNPFREPTRYWLYDTRAREPRKENGRRPAGYYFRERRSGGPQLSYLTDEQYNDLPIVNELRRIVREWRERGYPGVSPITQQLLAHWRREDRERRLFFCQLEAAETIIYLLETEVGRRRLNGIGLDGRLRRLGTKMATGSGKTVVMAMLAAWSVLNKAHAPGRARFADAVLVVCPNLTVRERLGGASHVVNGEEPAQPLIPGGKNNYYELFDLVPPHLLPEMGRGRFLITNWHTFLPQDDFRRRGIVQRAESDAAFCARVLHDLGNARNLLVINDEAHHCYRPKPLVDAEAQPSTEAREENEVGDSVDRRARRHSGRARRARLHRYVRHAVLHHR